MDFYFQRQYRGPLKAILLDWAGTTLDYGCYAPAVVFRQVFEKQDVPISMAEARGPMGAHKKVHIRKISQTESVRQRWQEARGRFPDETDVETMFAEFVPLQLACLADFADLIPGTLEAVADFRKQGLKIGSTTGYTGEMMNLLQGEAKKRGYAPDATVCATDVPEGRPAPWMCVKNAMELRVYPFEACVKVDDTIPGIEEGLNCGMWTIGLAKTGNEIGLNETEIEALDDETLDTRLRAAYLKMHQAGAHYVVDGIGDISKVLTDIQNRLATGERP
jgi:phosphonoacetaldehyde hydrolase